MLIFVRVKNKNLQMTNIEHISLLKLLEKVKGAVEGGSGGQIWVKAEISDIKNHPAGHCYLELVDTGEEESDVEARAQGIIWASVYKMLRPYFTTTTGYELTAGMHILVRVTVQFSPLYGLSLIISDIDPSFTVGEVELERQKNIKRLRQEGMFEMNKGLELPRLPRNFAVISSGSAAGYLDFIKHLHENEYGYRFRTKLFPAPMQGESAPSGIIGAIDMVAEEIDTFDALLILRGGGSQQDLRCFDDYELAVNIAQFPLPVITGIGHEQDFHIADMVAHTSVKTPTAVAAFITGIFIQEESLISSFASRLSLSLQARVLNEGSSLQRMADTLINICTNRISEGMHLLELAEQRVKINNPIALLKNGYAITVKNGKRVTAMELNREDKVEIFMKEGSADCTVNEVKIYRHEVKPDV
jgi:exodeoxyribonuclease VII large subunit